MHNSTLLAYENHMREAINLYVTALLYHGDTTYCTLERAHQLAEGYHKHIVALAEKFRDGCVHHADSDILDVDHEHEQCGEILDFINFGIFKVVKRELNKQ